MKDTNDTRKFLREFNEFWVREDVSAILDAVTDDIRFGMVGSQPVEGKKDFEALLNEMCGSNTDMALDISDVIVDGDRAAVTGEISMTTQDGQHRTYAFCDIYRLANGKVAELTAHVQEIGVSKE